MNFNFVKNLTYEWKKALEEEFIDIIPNGIDFDVIEDNDLIPIGSYNDRTKTIKFNMDMLKKIQPSKLNDEIVHEILHAIQFTQEYVEIVDMYSGHDELWQGLADKVNENFGLNVTARFNINNLKLTHLDEYPIWNLQKLKPFKNKIKKLNIQITLSNKNISSEIIGDNRFIVYKDFLYPENWHNYKNNYDFFYELCDFIISIFYAVNISDLDLEDTLFDMVENGYYEEIEDYLNTISTHDITKKISA